MTWVGRPTGPPRRGRRGLRPRVERFWTAFEGSEKCKMGW